MMTRDNLFHSNNAYTGQEELPPFRVAGPQDIRNGQPGTQGTREKLNLNIGDWECLGATQWIIKVTLSLSPELFVREGNPESSL